MQTKPNFFIVGAPKCGTTAMHAYLRQHPLVFMPALKEPHYFASDFTERGYIRNRRRYDELFTAARHAQWIGEASVWYLYSTEAARRIRDELGGHVRIIAMLRNPVDMLYSLHSQALVSGQENIRDFTRALDAEADRRAGRRWPRGRFDKKLLYSDVVDFAPQIERYFDAFGRDHVHVVFYDDFKLDSQNEYRRCVQFLDIESSFCPPLDVINRNKKVHSLPLQSLLRRPSPTVRSVVRTVVPSPVRRRLIRGLMRMNTSEQPRPPLDPDTRALLAKRFGAQVERLSKLLGRDLSGWFDPLPTMSAA